MVGWGGGVGHGLHRHGRTSDGKQLAVEHGLLGAKPKLEYRVRAQHVC